MRKVRLVSDARREFLKEVSYYESLRKGLGRRFRNATTAAIGRAGEFPLSGKPGVAETRRILVKGFPFAVVYTSTESEVVVFAVSHLSREPNYWVGRLPSGG